MNVIDAIRPDCFRDNERIVAAFSTRDGGNSQPPFDTLNLSVSVGDAPEAVKDNRSRFFGQFGVDVGDVAIAGLVHGAKVEYVSHPGLIKKCDGLVTDRPGLALAVTSADCALLFLADSGKGIVGACHAGWRGAIAGVASSTVDKMIESGARVGEIACYISPCISAESFEVGEEVAEKFGANHVRKAGGKWFADLKGHLEVELRSAGIRSIEVDPSCTYRDKDRFFSYRRDRHTGRMMGFIMLRD